MWLGGDKMIDAPNSGGVVGLTDLTASYPTGVPWILGSYG
jgi:hypothetical protein